MNTEQWESFIQTAAEITSKPEVFFAKKIKSVRCVNPDENISYIYQRVYELEFEDGSKLSVCEDHWRRPNIQFKPGNWYIKKGENLCEGYYTQEQLEERFLIAD